MVNRGGSGHGNFGGIQGEGFCFAVLFSQMLSQQHLPPSSNLGPTLTIVVASPVRQDIHPPILLTDWILTIQAVDGWMNRWLGAECISSARLPPVLS
jgi:hypothetical protein